MSCFFGHKWGKWGNYEETTIIMKTDYTVKETRIRQQKKCLTCGKIVNKKVL